jgi:glycosyltransferase involved in cell wall biosynthesis
MRLASLHHSDLNSEALWSGIPLNIMRNLRALGHEVALVHKLEPQAPFAGRVKTWFYKYAREKQYLMNRDPAMIRLRAKDGNRKLKAIGAVDAVLVTYPPDAAFVETSAPVILLHDATWPLLLDYYPGYERSRMARETIEGGMLLDRLAIERCDRLVYFSRWAESSAVETFAASRGKVSTALPGPNMVDLPARENVHSFLDRRGQGPMRLLFLGVEWHRKGGDIAVRVAAEIERRGVPVELHVAGCKPEGEVPQFVRAHGMLRKDVEREAKELRELLETSDFFLLPTRADALGVVFAESAAFGLPVMTAATGGVADAVREEWGFAPPPGTAAQSYADWAIERFRNRAEYERLAWLARDAYEGELNWPAYCRHIVSKVFEIAARPSAPSA